MANRQLYDAAAKLPDADLPCGARRLLRLRAPNADHLLVTDRIWMRRLTGEGPTYTALDVVPFR